MAKATQMCFLSRTVVRQLSIRIDHTGMRLVASPLPVKVPSIVPQILSALTTLAGHRGPRPDERPIFRIALVGRRERLLRLATNLRESVATISMQISR